MKVAGVQMSMAGNKKDTISKMLDFTNQAIKLGAKMICFPELILTNYFAFGLIEDCLSWAETLGGRSVSFFSQQALRLKVWFGLPLFELSSDGNRYNSYIIIDPQGKINGVYRKQYLPKIPRSQESNYFKPGSLFPCVFKVEDIKVAVQLCYDRHFPESTRLMALQGADLLLIPISSALRPGRSNTYQAELIARSCENNMYIMGINRVGREDDVQFFGGSLAIDPYGNVINVVDEHHSEEGLVLADVSKEFVIKARDQFRHLDSLRPDVYEAILNLLVNK